MKYRNLHDLFTYRVPVSKRRTDRDQTSERENDVSPGSPGSSSTFLPYSVSRFFRNKRVNQ